MRNDERSAVGTGTIAETPVGAGSMSTDAAARTPPEARRMRARPGRAGAAPRRLPLRLIPTALASAALLLGCAQPPPPTSPALLPVLPVAQTTPQQQRIAPATEDPFASLPEGPPITLSAVDVDVRVLLPAIAEAAGISMVLGPDVQGRVSVNLVDVPAREALQMILEQAELGVVTERPPPPWGPVVFYAIPVNIDQASVDLIRARFGVSRELAEWIVQNRVR